MTIEPPPREIGTVQDELRDLTNYLAGLPPELRASGAFEAYEQRAAELNRELMLSTVRQLTIQPGNPNWARIVGPPSGDYAHIREVLSKLASESQRSADALILRTRIIHWGTFVFSAGSLVSIVSPMFALAIPFSALAAALAGSLAMWRFTDRIKREERIAEHFAALRDELVHSFGISGEILGTSDYYAASARRFAELLDTIKAEASEAKRVGA